MKAIDKAIKHAGSPAKLAEMLGVTVAFIYQIRAGDRPIPPNQAASIEKATKGHVTARQLRPDLAKIFAA